MGTKYKFLKYTLVSSLLMPLSFGSTAETSGSVAAINSIAINGGTISITPTNIDSAGVFNGADAFELEFANNDPDGYTVTVTAEDGFLQLGSNATDGGKVSYTLACDTFNYANGVDANIAMSAADIGTSAYTVYTVTNPPANTVVNSSASNGGQQAPDCDIALASGETVDELLAGTYTESFTVAIANQ